VEDHLKNPIVPGRVQIQVLFEAEGRGGKERLEEMVGKKGRRTLTIRTTLLQNRKLLPLISSLCICQFSLSENPSSSWHSSQICASEALRKRASSFQNQSGLIVS